MAISPELRKRLEDLGEAQVRLVLNEEEFAPSLHDAVREWLAELTEAHQAREAHRSESTVKFTWITVYLAVGALALSVIAIIISVLSWVYPRH